MVHQPSLVYWHSRHLFSIHQGVHLPKYVHLPSFVYWYSRHLFSIHGGSIGQSGFICQVWCSVFKASILDPQWGPSAKVCSSDKLCVLVFKASILNSLGGSSAKVCSSAKFCVLVFKACILFSLGGPSAKVSSSAKFGVVVFKASMLNSLGSPSAKEGSFAKYELASKFTLASQRSFHITYKRPIIDRDSNTLHP